MISENMEQKQKRAMWRVMCKGRDMKFRKYTTRIQELKKYLSILTGLDKNKKIPKENINETMLHTMPNT